MGIGAYHLVWNLDRDVRRWRLGERPDLLFHNGDNEHDLDYEEKYIFGNFENGWAC